MIAVRWRQYTVGARQICGEPLLNLSATHFDGHVDGDNRVGFNAECTNAGLQAVCLD